MEHIALINTLVILVTLYGTSSDVQTPDVSLKEHVKKIEEMLADMRSHSQAQEQKSSAVLSSLLSQLTQTTDELRDLKASQNETSVMLERRDGELSQLWTSHNGTLSKLEDRDVELSELWASHNATASKLESTVLKLTEKDAELSELWETHNATVMELHALRAKHNNIVENLEETMSKLENFQMHPSPHGNIGFNCAITAGKNVAATKPIVFDRILHNSGASYKNNTGKIPVPMNGTYQIWIDFKYRGGETACRFLIKKNDIPIDKVYGSPSDAHETATALTVAYLQEGQSIWVEPTQSVHIDNPFCNFGIALLNSH